MAKFVGKVGDFEVSLTDARFNAYPNYTYLIECKDINLKWTAMWELDAWCRSMWSFPHWINEKRNNAFEWNKHGEWAQEFNYRLKEKRVYLRSEDEYLQFVIRWSGQ